MRPLILLLSIFLAVAPLTSQAMAQMPAQAAGPATATTTQAAATLLGRSVRSLDGKESGRIVDVVVTNSGQPVAVLVDFGGFMGVGNRRIAVDWARLRFDQPADAPVMVDLSAEQIKTAPDYKESLPPAPLPAETGQPSPQPPR